MGFVHFQQVRITCWVTENACCDEDANHHICLFFSLYAKYYFALRSLLEKSGFRDRYNQMVGGINGIAASEAIKVSKRSEAVKEEALLQLSRSMPA